MLLSIGRRCRPRGRRTRRLFTVLALECSADDTCAAVVTSSAQILSNVVVKQNHMYVCAVLLYVHSYTAYRHEDFGGIHPYKAVRAHQQNMVRFLLYITRRH